MSSVDSDKDQDHDNETNNGGDDNGGDDNSGDETDNSDDEYHKYVEAETIGELNCSHCDKPITDDTYTKCEKCTSH